MNDIINFPAIIPPKAVDMEIEELEKKLAELKKYKEEVSQRLVITYSNYNKHYKELDISLSKPSKEMVEILRSCPTHRWNGKSNIINLRDLKNLIGLMEANRVVADFKWEPEELSKTILDIISAPSLSITLTSDKRRIDIKPSVFIQGNFYPTGLDSFRKDGSGEFYFMDSNELWRFSIIIAKEYASYSIAYSKEALDLLNEQIERRKLIDELSKATDADIKVPLINGEMFHGFQRVALKFAQVTDYNCILALDMGLGKTPISIAISETLNARTLFVVPATLKTNTFREIKKWTGKEALILSGSAPDGLTVDCLIDKTKQTQYNIINYDIIGRETILEKSTKIGVPDVTMQKWVELINMSNFDLIVCDEIHYIKNMSSLRSKGVRGLKSPHKIGLTGTPIVNRPSELYPPLNVIAPNKFQRESDFLNAFMDREGNAKNVPRLHELLQDYMFRRKKEDVIKDLPPITRVNHFCTLSTKAQAHYDKALAGLYISLRNPSYQRNINSILAELTRLKQIISDDKIQTTVDLANTAWEETGEKVLIFSQFVETCNSIAGLLQDKLVITGHATDEERYERIDKFQKDDDTKFMVLSTKAGAEGITLTRAHTVIFNDLCWTPKDHRQAEARCYGRMSDMHGAIAYYVQAENTVDEMIGELLLKKLAIIEEVIDNIHTDQGDGASVAGELLDRLKRSMR